MQNNSIYTRFAKWASNFCGQPKVFIAAVVLIAVWIITGPMFHYSDTWQLVINTFTTIITFLMVFVIQNSQNRDTQAIQLKLDELICATQGAANALLDIEDLDDQKLKEMNAKYQTMGTSARGGLDQQDTPEDDPKN
ncbi:low affinity iron permease family protein [Aquirhabdus sp.]|uniref:low affinity iron permease family protein n=1 Tax=Aquirhabdus sp. TaxID=2824160 RepID=UPI00396C533B